jgi:hypothetical protein
MAKIRINGDTSGYIEISAPNVAGSTSITLPATTGGSLLATDASGNLNVDNGVLYVDGVNNRIGIGTTSPESLVHIDGNATAFRITRGSSIGFAYNTGTAVTDPFRIQSNGGAVDLYSAVSQPITFSAGTSEKARIDGSGRLLIATTSNTAGSLLQIYQDNNLTSGTINVTTAGGLTVISPSAVANYGAGVWFDHGSLRAGIASSRITTGNWGTDLRFYTHPDSTASQFEIIERMRITSNGNVFINSTSNPALGTEMFGVAAQTSGQVTAAAFTTTVNTAPTVFIANTSNTTNAYVMRFTTGTGGNTRGEIYYNGSQLVYATSSDYRLKENVVNFNNGTEIIKQLRPVKYNWIENNNEDIGFIAHEVQDVFPNAVGGEKDAVDDNGKILPQTYDPSKLVPLLTAALQESIKRIEQLEATNASFEARLSALEVKP